MDTGGYYWLHKSTGIHRMNTYKYIASKLWQKPHEYGLNCWPNTYSYDGNWNPRARERLRFTVFTQRNQTRIFNVLHHISESHLRVCNMVNRLFIQHRSTVRCSEFTYPHYANKVIVECNVKYYGLNSIYSNFTFQQVPAAFYTWYLILISCWTHLQRLRLFAYANR